MKPIIVWPFLIALVLTTASLAQDVSTVTGATIKMEMRHGVGDDAQGTNLKDSKLADFGELTTGVPTALLSNLVQDVVTERFGNERSAKDAEIYRRVSPSVVLITTKDGLGSGSLIDVAGSILTNWHVVSGYEYVAAVFKPMEEGKQYTRDEIKRARVIKYDEITDLALLKAVEVPAGRKPLRLGDSSEIAVGMDVHAIGHPTGEAWTYTTGVVSQYRQGYEWQAKGDSIKHRADIIQTQTPINPGNSGGPLVSDSANLVGVNSFKSGGEGLNFAVSVDEVKKFIVRAGNR
jgi:S1-C subfamily serine protease